MTDRVRLRGGADTAELLATARRVVTADTGRVAIVGGLAVTCRLQYAHRATTDVDTVVEERTPTVLEVLGDLSGAADDPKHPDRVVIDGVPVDVISTMPVDGADLDDGIEALFVLAHRFALESAELVIVELDGPDRYEVHLPVATPAGLVATKLCGVQGTRRRAPEKKATDGYDLFRLLDELDDEGAVAHVLREAGGPLLHAVREAANEVLIRRAATIVRNIDVYGGGLIRVTVDHMTFVGERFVDALSDETP